MGDRKESADSDKGKDSQKTKSSGKISSSGDPKKSGNPESKGKSGDTPSGGRIVRGSSDGASNSKAAKASVVSLMNAPPPGTVEQVDQGSNTALLKEILKQSKASDERLSNVVKSVQQLSERQDALQVQFDDGGESPYVPVPEGQGNDVNLEEDDEDLDKFYAHQADDYEDFEEEEEFEEDKVTDKLNLGQKREAPDPLQVVLWDSGRKVTSEYGDEDWKKLSIKGIVKRFTSHPGAVMFSAQKPDSQLLELHYKDRKDREKLYVEIQNAQGAIGAMSTKLLLKLQDKNDELANTIKDFDDPNVEIVDPRGEASQILKYIKQTLMENWAKSLSEVTKVAGATFSRIIMMRRHQFEEVVGTWKGAKTSLKRLQPNKEFLYGNKVGDLCKDLEVQSQLSPLSMTKGRGTWNTRFNRGGGGGYRGGGFRGGPRGFRGGRGSPGSRGPGQRRGGFRGQSSRVDQFKET